MSSFTYRVARGVARDIWVGEESSAMWTTYPKHPKNWERHPIWAAAFSNLGGGRPLLTFHCGEASPVPPASDAHARGSLFVIWWSFLVTWSCGSSLVSEPGRTKTASVLHLVSLCRAYTARSVVQLIDEPPPPSLPGTERDKNYYVFSEACKIQMKSEPAINCALWNWLQAITHL